MSKPAPADPPWLGHEPRDCSEHHTVGSRAWCHDCREWCYPDEGCKGCRLPALEDLLGNVFLYLDWRYVTRQLTSAQKELFADAVDVWRRRLHEADPVEPAPVERWWRE